MSSDILSQNEIDALLTGVDSGEVETEEEVPGADSEGLITYDFTSQDRVIRGRLPTLDMINERFAKDFRISLFGFLRRTPTITVNEIQMNKFGDYVHSLFMPSNLSIVKIKPLRGNALFVMNPTLVYSIVENFFGGSGKYHTKIEGRDFTQTEMNVVNAIVFKIFEDLKKAWKPVLDLDFELVNSEVNPHFANIVSDSEVVIISTFHIELDNTSGDLQLAIPYSMIEPIREELNAGMHSNSSDHDDRWEKILLESIKRSPLDITFPLTKIDLRLGDLKSLKPGDIFPIDMPDVINGVIEDIPVFRGKYGVSRGNHAVKISEFNHQENFTD